MSFYPPQEIAGVCLIPLCVVEGKRKHPVSLVTDFPKDLFFTNLGGGNVLLSKATSETRLIP